MEYDFYNRTPWPLTCVDQATTDGTTINPPNEHLESNQATGNTNPVGEWVLDSILGELSSRCTYARVGPDHKMIGTFAPDWTRIQIRDSSTHPVRVEIFGTLRTGHSYEADNFGRMRDRITIEAGFRTELAGPVAACAWSPERLDVFATDTDGRLLHAFTEGGPFALPFGRPPEMNWAVDAPWYPNPPIPSLDPTGGWELVGAQRTGNWHTAFPDGNIPDLPVLVDPPAPAPGRMLIHGTAVTACSWGPDRLDAFVAQPDGWTQHVWWDGSDWSVEEFGLSVRLGVGQLSAVTSGVNQLDLFYVEQASGTVHRLRFRDGWTPPTASWATPAPTGTISVAWTSAGGYVLLADMPEGIRRFDFKEAVVDPNNVTLELANGPHEIPPPITGFLPSMPAVVGVGTSDLDVFSRWWDGFGGYRLWEGRGGTWSYTAGSVGHPEALSGVAIARHPLADVTHVLAVVDGHLLHRTRSGGAWTSLWKERPNNAPLGTTVSVID